jgi:hypothetical protein
LTAVACILTAAPALAVSGGDVSIGWRIPNATSDGFTDITFPMTVAPETLHRSGTYFAMQFTFVGSCGAYMGLQPRPNLNGHERLHGVFSSFHAGTTSTDSHCTNGADGGPGVSCATEFDAVYGREYALTVRSTGAGTWAGTATDTVTGESNPIGEFTLPAECGNLEGSQGGFVEYYLAIPSCPQMPWIDVTFGAPSSSSGLVGTAKANNEYGGACLGQANYHSYTVGSGTRVTRGWLMAPDAGGSPGGDGGSLDAQAAPDADSSGDDSGGDTSSDAGDDQDGDANAGTPTSEGGAKGTQDGGGSGPAPSSSRSAPDGGCRCRLADGPRRTSMGPLVALAIVAAGMRRPSRPRVDPSDRR